LVAAGAQVTIAELVVTLDRRAAVAECEGATAPVANVYRLILEELRPLVPEESNGSAARPPVAERLLAADQVAELLGTTVRWVYAHAAELGARHLSRRCVRFAESAIRRRLARGA
jgi:predicted DNA-binding transcriptional regulator AlpA